MLLFFLEAYQGVPLEIKLVPGTTDVPLVEIADQKKAFLVGQRLWAFLKILRPKYLLRSRGNTLAEKSRETSPLIPCLTRLDSHLY